MAKQQIRSSQISDITANKLIRVEKRRSGWYNGAMAMDMMRWDDTVSNYNMSFVQITSTTYRNHPMYTSSVNGWYNTFRYASILGGQTIVTLNEPQPFYLFFEAKTSTTPITNGALVNIGYHWVVEKKISSVWTPQQFAADLFWGSSTTSTGAFSGYMSVPADYSVSPAVYKRDFEINAPNDVAVTAYNLSGSIYSSAFQSVNPPLLANTEYRLRVRTYVLSSSSSTTLSDFGSSLTVFVEGK